MVLSRFLPALSAATRRPEAECVRALLPQARLTECDGGGGGARDR